MVSRTEPPGEDDGFPLARRSSWVIRRESPHDRLGDLHVDRDADRHVVRESQAERGGQGQASGSPRGSPAAGRPAPRCTTPRRRAPRTGRRSPARTCVPVIHAVGVGDHDADRREHVRGEQRRRRRTASPAVFRSLSLREAVMPISSRKRQSTPWNRSTKKLSSARVTSALQAADRADDDAAEEQVQAGVEEDLVEQLAADDALSSLAWSCRRRCRRGVPSSRGPSPARPPLPLRAAWPAWWPCSPT